ncbi:hypothetical protein GCM10009554_57480 [Kribbella koreensis]|uniref:PhzF family phenazine biosynthesis protein n=1 Tax=Kribbella koreensis TaxID=57909 RepID=A0ABP4BPZ6_9ACTN
MVVDACQRQGRGGSPTAVLDEASYTDEERCRIPAELGTSHAVFIRATGVERGRPSYSLRFFTTEGELPACGHGTVAALALLAIRNGGSTFHAVLSTKSRTFEGWAIRTRDSSVDTPHRTDHRPPQPGSVTARFDPGPITLRAAHASELKAITTSLGLDGEGRLRGRRQASEVVASNACVASNGRPRLLLPVRSRAALANLSPDFDLLRATCDRYGLLGCYAYSIPDRHGRAAARMFAPSIGVPEDIANANSTACLAAHLTRSDTTHLTRSDTARPKRPGTNHLTRPDTSHLTVDTSHLTVDTSHLTVDTSHLIVDTSHLIVDTSHLIVDMGEHLGNPSTITATIDATHPDHPVRVGGQATIARTVLHHP